MKKSFTPLFRVWHLFNLVAISGLTFTGLARLTFLNKHTVADRIMNKLSEWGISLPEEKALIIAKEIRNTVWEWHYTFAVLLGVAIAIRIILMMNGTAKAPAMKLKNAKNMEIAIKHIVHQFICLAIVLLALTGTLYYFHDGLGVAKESVEWAKAIHEWIFVPLMLLIAAHIIGVVKFELSTKTPVVSKMIHGD